MLYSTIIIALMVIFSLLTQLILVSALKGGDGAVGFELPKPKSRKKPKITEEDRVNMQILANIDNYNGSSVGQVPVERGKK